MSVRHDSGPFINYDEQLVNIEAAYVTKLRLLESILSKLNQTEYVPSTHETLIERGLIYACQKYARELDLLHVQSISLRNTIFEQKNKHLGAEHSKNFDKNKIDFANHLEVVENLNEHHDKKMAQLRSESALFHTLNNVTGGGMAHANKFHNAVAQHFGWRI